MISREQRERAYVGSLQRVAIRQESNCQRYSDLFDQVVNDRRIREDWIPRKRKKSNLRRAYENSNDWLVDLGTRVSQGI